MTPEHIFMAAHGMNYFDNVTLEDGHVRFEKKFAGRFPDFKYSCDREYVVRLEMNDLLDKVGLRATYEMTFSSTLLGELLEAREGLET